MKSRPWSPPSGRYVSRRSPRTRESSGTPKRRPTTAAPCRVRLSRSVSRSTRAAMMSWMVAGTARRRSASGPCRPPRRSLRSPGAGGGSPRRRAGFPRSCRARILTSASESSFALEETRGHVSRISLHPALAGRSCPPGTRRATAGQSPGGCSARAARGGPESPATRYWRNSSELGSIQWRFSTTQARWALRGSRGGTCRAARRTSAP